MSKSNENLVELIKEKIKKEKYQKHYIETNYNTEEMERMFKVSNLLIRIDAKIEVMEEILGGIL